MNDQVSIPCPVPNCGAQIPIDPRALMQGAQFVCPRCQSSVGLAPESRYLVKETLDKFDALKSGLLDPKKNDPMS